MALSWSLPADFEKDGRVCATCIYKRGKNGDPKNANRGVPGAIGGDREELGELVEFSHGGEGSGRKAHTAFALLPEQAMKLARSLGLPDEDIAVLEGLDVFQKGPSSAEQQVMEVPEEVPAEQLKESLLRMVKAGMDAVDENPFVIKLDAECASWIAGERVRRMDNFERKIKGYVETGALTVGVDIQSSAGTPFVVSVDGLFRILMQNKSKNGNKTRDYFIMVKNEYKRVCKELQDRDVEIARLKEAKQGNMEVAGVESLVNELKRKADELKDERFDKQLKLAKMDTAFVEKDVGFAKKETEIAIARKDTEVAKKDTEVARKEIEIAKKDSEIVKKDVEIARMAAEIALAKKDAEILLMKKDGDIAKKEADILSREAEISKKEADIMSREAEITKKDEEISEKDQELATKEEEIRTLKEACAYEVKIANNTL